MGGGIIGQLRPQLQNVIQNQDHHEHLEHFSKTLWEKLIICKHYKRRRVPKKAKSKFFIIYPILTSPAQDGIFLIGFHPHAPSQLVCSSFFARSKRNSHHFGQKLHIDEPWQSCSSHHQIAIWICFWSQGAAKAVSVFVKLNQNINKYSDANAVQMNRLSFIHFQRNQPSTSSAITIISEHQLRKFLQIYL